MKNRIPEERLNAYLRFLGRAIVLARVACQNKDTDRAEAILDAIHNLPRFLVGEEYTEFEANFRTFYLDPLVKRYPDLKGLADECPRPEGLPP